MRYTNLLERYAKLTTKVDANEDDLKVNVYNDNNTLVMWLVGGFNYDEFIDATVLDIAEVNFNDYAYFALSESEQDNCALVLFRAFLKYYQANYGKDSGEWLPVSASFANYKLQEKFKLAVDKGIFPPESKKLSSFTSEDAWKAHPVYNMDNRHQQYDIRSNPQQFLQSLFPNFEISAEGEFVNTPVLDIMNANVDASYSHIQFNRLFARFINGDIFLRFPNVVGNTNYGTAFSYNTDNPTVIRVAESVAKFNNEVMVNFDNFLYVTQGLIGIQYPFSDDPISLTELRQQIARLSINKIPKNC